jgi:hypothetical protein
MFLGEYLAAVVKAFTPKEDIITDVSGSEDTLINRAALLIFLDEYLAVVAKAFTPKEDIITTIEKEKKR